MDGLSALPWMAAGVKVPSPCAAVYLLEMDPERWKQIDELFQAARGRVDEERKTFLEQSCAGNDDLRREVETLLRHWDQALTFIETPAAGGVSESMIGKTVSRYRIVDRLGEGGMGVVYKAEDTQLGRHVALKFLPNEYTQDRLALERFRREARAASALDHPHICAIFDIGEHEGRPFIVMQCLQGATLKHHLQDGKPLPIDRVIELATEVADALTAAHARGIVHRDIKPANIFVTDRGEAKVLDFGLAKLSVERKGGSDAPTMSGAFEQATAPGLVMGTVDYMSPEQALGREQDSRTDIFSFGVVLYEMATGRRPFGGSAATDTINRIVNAQPEAVARFNYDVPAELDRIIRKCLEKERDRRYQSMKEIFVDLKNLRRDTDRGYTLPPRAESPSRPFPVRRAVTGVLSLLVVFALAVSSVMLWRWRTPDPATVSTAAPIRLAVVPFLKLTPVDSSLENVLLALMDDIIGRLSVAGGENLIVVPTASIIPYADKRDPATLRRELGVDRVLDLSLRQTAETVLIQLVLIDTVENRALWRRPVERPKAQISDVMVAMPELFREGLKLTLPPDAEQRLIQSGTNNREAEDEFYRGRQLTIVDATKEDLDRARQYLEHAIKLDPNFSRAHATLARILWWQVDFGYADASQLNVARQIVKTALDLDYSNSEAHVLYGYLSLGEQPEQAYRDVFRAVDLEPNNENNLHTLGVIYQNWGLYEECLRMADRIGKLNPKDPYAQTQRGRILAWEGKYAEAERWMATYLSQNPRTTVAIELALMRVEQKDYDGARELRAPFGNSMPGKILDFILESAERPDLRPDPPEAAMKFSEADGIAAFDLAVGFALSKRADAAVSRLKKAEARGFMNPLFLRRSPLFDRIRDAREFQDYTAGLERRRDSVLAHLRLSANRFEK